MINLEDIDDVFEQYFLSDGGLLVQNRRCVSIIQQLSRDMKFNNGDFKYLFSKDELSIEARLTIKKIRPALIVPIIYCLAVDHLARIIYGKPGHKPGSVGELFKKSAREIFEHTPDEAELLWDVRNDMVHAYSVEFVSASVGRVETQQVNGTVTTRVLTIHKDKDSGIVYFNTHRMEKNIEECRKRLYKKYIVSDEKDKIFKNIANFGLQISIS